MAPITISLPDPDFWPLKVFLFVRRAGDNASPATTPAYSKDLRYYLRAMRGPHWRMTVPLCVNGATDEDVAVLEAALAYMETSFCARWFYPMDAWTPTRVVVIAVHAWARGDARLRPRDWEGMRDLIPHVTPHQRDGDVHDMLPTVQGLARLYKEFLPMDIFHYRKMYYREHTRAICAVFQISRWRDSTTQTDSMDTEGSLAEMVDAMVPRGNAPLPDAYDSDIHRAEDPRESTSIVVTAESLPRLFGFGILLQIPLSGSYS